MVVAVSSPSGVVLEMRSISMIHHLAGTYADTVAPGHEHRAQGQRESCGHNELSRLPSNSWVSTNVCFWTAGAFSLSFGLVLMPSLPDLKVETCSGERAVLLPVLPECL